MGSSGWPNPLTARPPAHELDVALARTVASFACASLASLFAATMVGFTLLRLAGLQRALVPRSGVVGVGVAWTIAACALLASPAPFAPDPAPFAPGAPAHALLVGLPAQTAFGLSLARRNLLPKAQLAKLLALYAAAILCLVLARALSASDPEIHLGPEREDGTREALDATAAATECLVAIARALAGAILVAAASDRSPGNLIPAEKNRSPGAEAGAGASTKASAKASTKASASVSASPPAASPTHGSRHELALAACWCAAVLAMAPPRFGGEAPFADALGGAASTAEGSAEPSPVGAAMARWYACRAGAYALAHWGGLLTCKLAPGRFFAEGAATKYNRGASSSGTEGAGAGKDGDRGETKKDK